MRCPRCGNENPDENRFCGMCGGTLLAAPEAPTTQPQRVAAAASATAPAKEAPRTQVSEAPRPAPPPPSEPPTISGPSFLGLNDPAPRKRASLSIDPHSATSHNLDYLLEDDGEHHKSSGAGKMILIVVALALAVGLGYLRWRQQGFGWLGSPAKPTAATPTASDTTSSSSAVSPAPTSPSTAASEPATHPAAVPAAPGSTTATPAPANAAPSPASPVPSTTDTANPADTTTSAANPAANPDKPAPNAANATPAAKPPADTSAATDASDAAKPAPAPPAPKSPAEVKRAPPVDPVVEAQKYLYGRGVPQDCNRGMRLLKPAANESNPKAMIEMGALYSAGLCTPHDLPTAYRWFALALRKDPDNQDVQNDLQKLWGEMTQAERQLAIRLTQ